MTHIIDEVNIGNSTPGQVWCYQWSQVDYSFLMDSVLWTIWILKLPAKLQIEL